MSEPDDRPADREHCRVLIVDDDPFVRSGLRLVLDSATDLEVIAEAADGVEAVETARRCSPDVVLMDVRMPRLNGIEATAQLTRLSAPPRVVVLTAFDLDRYVLDALRAGASGFLLKDAEPERIIEAVRTVARGDALLAPQATRTLIAHVVDPAATDRRTAARDALSRLTERERQVAALVADGHANAAIAAELHLSEATVKTYVSEVLSKLAVGNRVQIAITVRDAQD